MMSFSSACVCPSSSRLYDGSPAEPMPTPLRSTTSLTMNSVGRLRRAGGRVSRYRVKAFSTFLHLLVDLVHAVAHREVALVVFDLGLLGQHVDTGVEAGLLQHPVD